MKHGRFDAFGGDHVAVRVHASGHPVDACFSDEVAIDFPSLAPVVRRMRRAFVADLHPVAYDTVIHLSRQQALQGTTVQLEVPVRAECRPCGGRGEVWHGACPACEGRGVTVQSRPVRVTVPPGARDGASYRMTIARAQTPPTRIALHVLVA